MSCEHSKVYSQHPTDDNTDGLVWWICCNCGELGHDLERMSTFQSSETDALQRAYNHTERKKSGRGE